MRLGEFPKSGLKSPTCLGIEQNKVISSQRSDIFPDSIVICLDIKSQSKVVYSLQELVQLVQRGMKTFSKEEDTTVLSEEVGSHANMLGDNRHKLYLAMTPRII